MNYVIENMKSRRSVRSFLDQKVPKKLLEEILEAARYAPSALNKQPWEFIVITNKRLIECLSAAITKIMKKIYAKSPILKIFNKRLRDERTFSALKKTATSKTDTVFYNAPALIFITSGVKDKWVETNCALAAQNMMLSAHSLGLGSCFVGRGFFVASSKALSENIGLGRGRKIYAVLAIGYPGEFPKNVPQREKDNLICWKD